MRLFFSFAAILCSSTLMAQVLNSDSFKPVNSFFDEQNPMISPDGQTLFFTVSNHPSNIGGKKDPGDIWFSRLISGQWSAPVHAGSLLNDRAYNAVAGFSANGEQLYTSISLTIRINQDYSAERFRTMAAFLFFPRIHTVAMALTISMFALMTMANGLNRKTLAVQSTHSFRN
jgi:hypothetical protein